MSFYISIPNLRPVLCSRAARGACSQPELGSDQQHRPGLWTLLWLAPGVGHLSLCIRPPTTGEKDDIDVSAINAQCLSPYTWAVPFLRSQRSSLLCCTFGGLITQCYVVLSVEVLKLADSLFVLTASSDGSTSLWTNNGEHVGRFGQEAAWNITEPATYQR